MINRDFILNHFTQNIETYQQYARNIAGIDDAPDLMSECTLMLLEFSEERLISYWNKSEGLKPCFIRMLMLQYRSKTSYFHGKYRKENEQINKKGADIAYSDHASKIENPAHEMSDISRIANNVSDNEFENIIWNAYVETGSLRKALAALPDEYRECINIGLIRAIVTKFRQEIKQRLATL